MATIKDVAREAGVSIATVSYYLNQTKPVSKETAKAIQAAIDKLKYSHNMIARKLRVQKNMDIGVILPDLDDSYCMQIFQGIKSYFRNTEYVIHVEVTKNIPEFERNVAESFLKRQVCGLFLMSCQPDSWKFYYESFTSRGIPIVLIDRNIHSLDANFVSFDNYKFMKIMTEKLLRKGCRQLYLVSGSEGFTCEADAIRGFIDACKNYGVSVNKDMFIKTDMSKEDAFRKTIKFLKNKKVEGVVTTMESIAIGVMEGLAILNIDTKEVPVATFGEEHWNYYTHSFAFEVIIRSAIRLGQTASKLMERQLTEPLSRETEKIILTDWRMSAKKNILMPKREIACNEPKKIRVLLYHTEQVTALLGLIQNFENVTGIEVEAIVVDYDNLYDTIVQSYSEGVAPFDVFMYAMTWMPFFASEHMLVNITEEVKELKGIFFENSLKYFAEYKKQYYGIPFLYGPQILYYRKDLFADPLLKEKYEKTSNISLRPPVTLKEYNTIADFFTNRTDAIPYGITIPGRDTACLVQEIHLRLLAFGGELFDEQGNVCLNSEQTLKAYINFMRSVKCAKPDFREDDNSGAVEAFMNGETAMLITYPTNFMRVTDLRKSSEIGTIGYHVVPGRATLLGGMGLGISSRSTQKKEAMEFLRWICDEQVASYMTLLGGQTAVSSAYTNDMLVEQFPWLRLYHSVSRSAKPILSPTLQNGKVIPLPEIDDIVGRWVYKLLDTDIEVQDAINHTHQDLEKLVEKYMK